MTVVRAGTSHRLGHNQKIERLGMWVSHFSLNDNYAPTNS